MKTSENGLFASMEWWKNYIQFSRYFEARYFVAAMLLTWALVSTAPWADNYDDDDDDGGDDDGGGGDGNDGETHNFQWMGLLAPSTTLVNYRLRIDVVLAAGSVHAHYLYWS